MGDRARSLIARQWRPQWICHSCQQRQPQYRPLATSSLTPAEQNKPYYVTTPIFYVNAAPHVGHMYTMILTDVLKRWQQMKNRKAILLTGTDEHGMKVQRAAAKAGVEPQEFCDKGAEVFKELAGSIDISNDIFMRTSDKKHKEAVEYAWQMLEQRGYIYESKHEGWYSVSDETFYPQGQVQLIVDPPTGRKIMASIETGKEVEWTSERNYHFRLSAFREDLLEFYKQNPKFIVPQTRMNEIVRQVSDGLEDLSISRPVERLTWGVRVPTDPSQTMYVWLDALLNYATGVGYPFTPGSEAASGWPADVHVVGKDIIRFHCIYWPAFLMALDLPLPKQVLTTAHWTLGKQKMSKSVGNVVNPIFALERFGTDVMRWYLVHDGGITDDADYDNIHIVEKYKKGLQGGIGNLTSRVLKGRGWNLRRAVESFARPHLDPAHFLNETDTLGRDTYNHLQVLPTEANNLMDDLLPNKALQRIMDSIYTANAYVQHAAPWSLVKMRQAEEQSLSANKKRIEQLDRDAHRIVFVTGETLRMVGIMLQPFMPVKAKELLDMLGVVEERRNWEWCAVGKDDGYGVSMKDLGKRGDGQLFPMLINQW
ncbi:methionyl-tRNA synthetase [Saxophila tyrrhenica]|uniref:Probable methionine--tRNA ligase, mitochondrial n=1 Tax=Saxophila tyrrhenica TaxID=1690608 RepID=A0AAV9NWB2_9PEZI|nr:methionyl-tRNA synthetase [Saxophila tyrrhenica]